MEKKKKKEKIGKCFLGEIEHRNNPIVAIKEHWTLKKKMDNPPTYKQKETTWSDDLPLYLLA